MNTKKQLTIEDYERCPHCGSDIGYYTKLYVSGWLRDVTLFSRDKDTGTREKENTEEYDLLKYSRESKYYYCYACEKRICKVEDNILKELNE